MSKYTISKTDSEYTFTLTLSHDEARQYVGDYANIDEDATEDELETITDAGVLSAFVALAENNLPEELEYALQEDAACDLETAKETLEELTEKLNWK